MIKIVDGNLLDASEDIIGHQVNCQGVMGSGVAKQLRSKYKGLFEEYRYHLDTFGYGKLSLGQCQFVAFEDKVVANLFGQNEYGYGKQFTDIGALTTSLCLLKEFALENNKSVALPYKIGSDRGGASWNEVYRIIGNVFMEYVVTLYKL